MSIYARLNRGANGKAQKKSFNVFTVNLGDNLNRSVS
jgi:hypothetical protein